MIAGQISKGERRLADWWLTATVHLDGFRASPFAYLRAAMWWVLRKRVRARGQLAPLLANSPKAYELWALRQQENPSASDWAKSSPPPLVALLAETGDTAGLSVTLASLAAERIPAIFVPNTGKRDIAAALSKVDLEQHQWLMPLRAGDLLASGAAAAYSKAIASAETAVIYADDDLLDRWGRRTGPHFKPAWNSELFRHFDYLTGACIVRAQPDDLVAVSNERDWAHALVSLAALRGGAIQLRQVLHHRTSRPTPVQTAVSLPVAPELPLVTVIIPTRNRLDLLRTCLDGIAATTYPNLEVIVIDNDSDDPATLAYLSELDLRQVRVLRHPGAFNYSAINNRAASEARGTLLCLLNNDIEVISPDWLAIMATQALRDEVGAVGAQLLYPDGRIQHAGVVIGVGNAAGHAHRFMHPDTEGYFRRHALPQFTMAVTGACLVVSREKFMAVGGLDEHNFAVAYNDVDLCLRLNQRGWQSLYEPRAVLVHHESVSRGHDRDPVGAARFADELAALKRIWRTDEIIDPYHHPYLSRASEQYVIAI